MPMFPMRTAVQAAIATVIQELGRIDAVHNNAGIVGPSKPLHETTEEEFDKLQQVNVKSVYWTTKFAFPALVATKGAILNTASMVGLLGQQDHAAYVSTKGGMISLTKAMAADYARYQIRVNAVCPPGFGRPCWNNGALISRIRAASGSTSMIFIFSDIALTAMLLRTQRCFCFRPRPDLSPAASCR